MGATLAAWTNTSAGGFAYRWVIAIEGYEYLITNGSPSAAVTAWAGTDWTQAIGGALPDLDRSQTFHPLQAFPAGGRFTLRVVPDADDTFGRALFKQDVSPTTNLTSTIDSNDTTIAVTDTTYFAAATSELYIGNECIEYNAKTATTFTASKRGKYSPFLTSTSGRFGRPHHAGLNNALTANLEPVVSQARRTWVGAMVGVWVHREVDGVLDTKANAHLVFAGTIAEVRDDAETGAAVLEVVDILERVKNTTMFKRGWRAQLKEGVYIGNDANTTSVFTYREALGAFLYTATPLEIKTSGASGHTQMNAGYYTVDQLCNILNTWLATEHALGHINLTHNIELTYTTNTTNNVTGYLVRDTWGHSSTNDCVWEMKLPTRVAVLLGIVEEPPTAQVVVWEDGPQPGSGNTIPNEAIGATYPYRVFLPATLDETVAIQLDEIAGTFWDNYDWLPQGFGVPVQEVKPPTADSLAWGVFKLNGRPFIVGAVSGTELLRAKWIYPEGTAAEPVGTRYGKDPDRSVGVVDLVLEQFYLLAGTFAEVTLAVFLSTGTAGFNDPTHDTLPAAIGLGIPYDLASALVTTLGYVTAADAQLLVVIDKPLTVEKVFNVDWILRRSHLVWKDQGLQIHSWGTPLAGNADVHLTESNKAMPAGNRGAQRSALTVSTEWLTPIVKIRYDRDWVSDQYKGGPLVLQDAVSIDDLGGEAPEKTLDARNMYAEAVAVIAADFLQEMPLISRPTVKLRRTIAQTLYPSLTPGATVLVTDGFARSPSTGYRGITSVPGIVTLVRYALGGWVSAPGDAVPQVGEVEVMLFPGKRFAEYAPSAQVDSTVNTGGFSAGYNAGTLTLRCLAHEFSEATDASDASRFQAGDAIEIIDMDPASAATPTRWERTIDSISGNDIMLTAALSAPVWNSARTYRIRSQGYAAASTTQRVYAYQADDADTRIANLADPFHYAVAGAAHSPHTLETHTTGKAELIPTVAYGDGVPRDVAMERALVRTLNNLFDHKCAHQAPMLRTTALANTTYNGPQLVLVEDRFMGRVRPTAHSQRYLSVAPTLRSSTGATIEVTVHLCRAWPTANAINNILPAGMYASATWSTSSTTWATGTPQDLDLAVIGADGVGVIWVTVTQYGETKGLARCVVTERR